MMSRPVSGYTVPAAHTTPCEGLARAWRIDSILNFTHPNRAGKDAARSFGTGCFATHQTHDLRGLDEQEIQVNISPFRTFLPFFTHPPLLLPNFFKSVEHWKKFFADSDKYHKVGRVLHRPIDPSSPIPEHCDEEKRKAQKEREANAKPLRKAEL